MFANMTIRLLISARSSCRPRYSISGFAIWLMLLLPMHIQLRMTRTWLIISVFTAQRSSLLTLLLNATYGKITPGSVASGTLSMAPPYADTAAATLGNNGSYDDTLIEDPVTTWIQWVIRSRAPSSAWMTSSWTRSRPAEALQDSSMRHKLTMTCSFCGQAYARTADLIRHLQCHHGGFFRAADLTSNMIDEARLSCVCNPCRVPQPRSHRCPAHRQMAMLQHLCDPHHRRLMLPWAPTEASVQQLIQLHTLLHAQVPELGQWLLHPDRTSWTFMMRHCQVLSHSCILCSRTFEKSDQLFDHLTQTHRTHSSSCGFLLHAMLRYLLAQRPALADTLPCSWCGNTAKNYSLLDESAWSRVEHQCSSLLNLGCAVAWLRPDLHDGRNDANPRRRPCDTGGQGILKYARVTGRLDLELPQEKRKRKETTPLQPSRRRASLASSPRTNSSTSSTRDEDPPQLNKLCRLMGQLLIRHEDQMNSVCMQDSFVIFFQRGNAGVLPLLMRSAGQWRNLPQDQVMMPLRSFLIQAVVAELVTRFQKLKTQLQDDSTKKAAIQSKTVMEDHSFPHLTWSSKHQSLEIMQTAPIAWNTMESHLGLLQQAFQEPGNCIRFFAMAAQNSRGEVIPWRLQISLRNDSLASLLKLLAGSSLWNLVGARMRQHGPQRSQLAQDLQQILRPRGDRR